METWLLVIALVGAVGSLLATRGFPRVWLVALGVACGAAAWAGLRILVLGGAFDWISGFEVGGERVHLALDGLSAYFLVLICVVCGAATVYSREYWTEERHPRSAREGRLWWTVLLTSMCLLVMMRNGLHFLLTWETFAISAYFLITLNRQSGEARSAGWLYLVASHAGTLCLFLFFGVLAARTGSWELTDWTDRSDLGWLFWLALCGFGVKAGLFPLHLWLPGAHANAPSHVSAVMSGVALKMGIYGLFRFSTWLAVPESAGWVLVGLGVASALLGVIFALGQHDYKRLLAYHSVENIGIILMGFGFGLVGMAHGNTLWGHLALLGGLLHVWNHALFKSLLFLGAGSVLHASGTRVMSRLGGLWKRMPWTAALFALGAVAIVGLPPLNGFVSEFLVYLGLFGAAREGATASLPAIATAGALAVTGALALACFAKVCGVVFLGAPRSVEAEKVHECGISMRAAMLILAGLCVVIGLAPNVFVPLASVAATAWDGSFANSELPEALHSLGKAHWAIALGGGVLAVLLWRTTKRIPHSKSPTWDCGYAKPSARMQYTAGAFAGIVTAWFDWILRRVRHETAVSDYFPKSASFEEHTPEIVIEEVAKPTAERIMRAATFARRWQHGRIQSYLVYLLSGVVGAGLVAWMAIRY